MSQLCVLPFSSVIFLENAKVFGFFFFKYLFLKSDFLLLTLTWGSLTLAFWPFLLCSVVLFTTSHKTVHNTKVKTFDDGDS